MKPSRVITRACTFSLRFSKDTLTNELSSISTDPKITHFGLEARYDNGQSAPFSGLADSITIHGQDGVVNLNGLRGETKPPTQFRVVVEREVELPESDSETGATRKKTTRIASDYVDVIILKEGEEDRPGEWFGCVYSHEGQHVHAFCD